MTENNEKAALVLFSGGQDSTVSLAWALERFGRVETIGFDYGQRHAVELQCREGVLKELAARFPEWQERLGPDHEIDLTALGQMSDTALTREVEIELDASGLPNTFVPGRNLVFFTLAAALGYRRGLKALVGGMCETDFSGYPDCRDAALQALAQAVRLGTEADFTIETPLMALTKAQTWALAHDLGGPAFVELIVDYTHSCYKGERETRHDWGYGCGACPACTLRAKGYQEWRQSARRPATRERV